MSVSRRKIGKMDSPISLAEPHREGDMSLQNFSLQAAALGLSFSGRGKAQMDDECCMRLTKALTSPVLHCFSTLMMLFTIYSTPMMCQALC